MVVAEVGRNRRSVSPSKCNTGTSASTASRGTVTTSTSTTTDVVLRSSPGGLRRSGSGSRAPLRLTLLRVFLALLAPVLTRFFLLSQPSETRAPLPQQLQLKSTSRFVASFQWVPSR